MKIIIIPIIILFMSCATQFFIIESDFYENDTGNRGRLCQTILISNPPRNEIKLAEIIKEYNRSTISYEEILEYDIQRTFYKETRYLTRNFSKGEPYPTLWGDFLYGSKYGQQVTQHTNSILAYSNIFITLDNKMIYLFSASSINYKDDNIYSFVIDNPEEFYVK